MKLIISPRLRQIETDVTLRQISSFDVTHSTINENLSLVLDILYTSCTSVL